MDLDCTDPLKTLTLENIRNIWRTFDVTALAREAMWTLALEVVDQIVTDSTERTWSIFAVV
jgi:hypothetical protein